MTSVHPVGQVETSTPAAGLPSPAKRRRRVVELDILRGFLLLWMTLTHLPTKASVVSNQTFGFVSGAEGFIFLAAFMVGWLEHGIEQKRGQVGTLRDVSKRTFRIYVYHCVLLAIAFTLVAEVGVSFHRLALENLLSFYLQNPTHAVIAAALLEYRPSLLDILPMYIMFMILTPIAREIARRWSWKPVILMSVAVWLPAQFGLRTWVYNHVNPFGLSVPQPSTGAFDLYAWQLLWMVGLALGTIYADNISEDVALGAAPRPVRIPGWLLKLSIITAAILLVLRYSPVDHWMNPSLYGWFIDKWHLGPARIVNFTALAIILVRFGDRIAALPFIKPLASLGQASIEVFSVHVLFCVAANAISGDADPMLLWWQQIIVLGLTIPALFATAKVARRLSARRKQLALKPVTA